MYALRLLHWIFIHHGMTMEGFINAFRVNLPASLHASEIGHGALKLGVRMDLLAESPTPGDPQVELL